MTTMATIGVRELRLKIGQHLDNVLRGVCFKVTRQGRPIAYLISVDEYRRLKAAAGESEEKE